MSIEDIGKIAQNCIQNHPVVVLGSGASVPHSIRGMGALAGVLRENLTLEGQEEEDAWTLIRTALANGDGLEEALQKTAVPPSLVRKIVEHTWLTIAADDLALLQRAAKGEEPFPLSDLIRGLFKSTNNTIHIVTPNYDRVAEYAADVADYIHAIGFVPGFIRRREVPIRSPCERGVIRPGSCGFGKFTARSIGLKMNKGKSSPFHSAILCRRASRR